MAFGTPSAIGGTSILEQPTGFELSISGGTQVVGIGVDVTGVQANSNIGAISIDDTTLTGIGWGRRTWGNLAWGGAYSAQALGQQLTSTINFPADNAFTDVVVQPTGLQLDSTFANPAFSVKVDSVLTVLVFEDDMTITVASPQEVGGLANVDAPSAGQATMSIGNTVGGLKNTGRCNWHPIYNEFRKYKTCSNYSRTCNFTSDDLVTRTSSRNTRTKTRSFWS